MEKINKNELKKICIELNEICKNSDYEYKDSKEHLIRLFHQLESHDFKDENEVRELIELHENLSEIKNRKASYIENEIGRRILVDLPFLIRMKDKEIPENIVEELKPRIQRDQRLAIKMSSLLLEYGKEIISRKGDKSKRLKNRVKEAIKLLNELQQLYRIKGIKEIFKSKIADKNEDLQFFALYGLEVYYSHQNTDELTEEEEDKLEEIIKSTKTREIASTCCQILINAEKIDEFGAIMRIDDWKDRNWK